MVRLLLALIVLTLAVACAAQDTGPTPEAFDGALAPSRARGKARVAFPRTPERP